jgi:hypothetical protein
MPDGSVPNPLALYPTPPAPAAGAMNPLQAVGLANALTGLQSNQQALAARQATGEAFRGALRDDGSIDQGALAASLRASPAAAYSLPEVAGLALNQATAQTDLDAKRNQFILDSVGATANDPNLNADKVRSLGVTLARNLRIPSAMINDWLDNLPKGKEALRAKLIQFRNMATGSANLSTPTPTGITPEGAPISAPRDVYNYRTAGGGIQGGLAPGEQGLSESAAGRAAALQATASTSPQYRADLANLKQMSRVLDIGGPTVKYEKPLAQVAQRFGLPSTLSPDQLKASEEFDKLANTIALNQGKALGGTDAARVLSVGATPSSGMSRFGREGVIDILAGNQDFIDRARDAWLESRSNGTPASLHDVFMHRFGKTYDVRTFQFAKLDRQNQQKFLDQLDAAEVPAFERSYQEAQKRGWVPPLKAAQ